MRKNYISVDGVWVEKGRAPVSAKRVGFEIMPDIQPYQSMVTGETITSRSKHRQHLRDHGMMEIGNDSSLRKPYTGMPDANPEQRKEILRHQVNQSTDKQWRSMGEQHRQAVIRYMERNGKG